MHSVPRVSVLLPVFNGAAFLRESIASILAQDFGDFEIVVVDDGSSDDSIPIIQSFNDGRIRLHANAKNIGMTGALNVGLALCRGEYIARMDADDICHPFRFSRQVAFLDRHPEVGLVGSAIWVVDRAGRLYDFVPQPRTDDAIRFVAMTKNPFHHPTVMLRRRVLTEHSLTYDPAFSNQDYKLWADLLRVTKGANLGSPLLRYRVHGENFSTLHSGEQVQTSIDICLQIQSDIFGHAWLTKDELYAIFTTFFGSRPSTVTSADVAERGFVGITRVALDRFPSAQWHIRTWAACIAPEVASRIDRPAWLLQFLVRMPAYALWLRRFAGDVWRLKIARLFIGSR